MTVTAMAGFTRRVLLLGGIVACVIALILGFGTALAADQRLADADAALQKAAALLEASESGVVSEKARKQFDRAVARALADLEDARAEIVRAQEAVDDP
jgi:hypothetical protein